MQTTQAAPPAVLAAEHGHGGTDAEIDLRADEVHVWSIDVSRVPVARGRDRLDADERSRADRFRFPGDRARYLAAHVALREILGRYLGIDPARLRYSTTGLGKPFVPGRPIEFSLSHSGDAILIAVARDRAVGVDVERIQPEFPFQAIVDRYFPAHEKSALLRVHPSGRCRQFFGMWTRKEAALKLTGRGLGGLEPARCRPDEEPRCSVRSLEMGAGYAAALATGNASLTLRYMPGGSRPHAGSAADGLQGV